MPRRDKSRLIWNRCAEEITRLLYFTRPKTAARRRRCSPTIADGGPPRKETRRYKDMARGQAGRRGEGEGFFALVLVLVEATTAATTVYTRARDDSRGALKDTPRSASWLARSLARANSDYYEAARSYGRRLIISPVRTLLLSLLL